MITRSWFTIFPPQYIGITSYLMRYFTEFGSLLGALCKSGWQSHNYGHFITITTSSSKRLQRDRATRYRPNYKKTRSYHRIIPDLDPMKNSLGYIHAPNDNVYLSSSLRTDRATIRIEYTTHRLSCSRLTLTYCIIHCIFYCIVLAFFIVLLLLYVSLFVLILVHV